MKALLINIGTDRIALYRVEEFYAKRDAEVLLGEGVSVSDLNDDALARALDSLYDAGLEQLYPCIAMHTLQQLKVIDPSEELFAIHADITSLSVTGGIQTRASFVSTEAFQKTTGQADCIWPLHRTGPRNLWKLQSWELRRPYLEL